MKLRQRIEIVELDVGQQRRPNDAGIVHDMRHGEAAGDLRRRPLGRGAIEQIDLYRMQPLVRCLRLAQSERNDVVVRRQHLPANLRADPARGRR